MEWWGYVLLVVAVVIFYAGILATFRARRLDSMNKQVTKSRRALENALAARARYAHEVGASGVLDPASAILLTAASEDARDASMFPVVEDGLEAIRFGDDGGVRGGRAKLGEGFSPDRLAIESELSSTLRLTVDELEPEDLDDESSALIADLNKAREEVRLTRRFHDSHVTQVQRLRRTKLVRILRLTGSAPKPRTVDMDDV